MSDFSGLGSGLIDQSQKIGAGQARNLVKLNDRLVGPLFRRARILTQILVDQLNPVWVQLLQFGGQDGGQSLSCAQVDPMPCLPDQTLGLYAHKSADPEELENLSVRLWGGSRHGQLK